MMTVIPQLDAQLAAREHMRRLAHVWQAKVLAQAGPAVKHAQLDTTITIQRCLLTRAAPRPRLVSHVLPARFRAALARRIVWTVPLAGIKTVPQQQPARLALLAPT
jgi:hypothetical protein